MKFKKKRISCANKVKHKTMRNAYIAAHVLFKRKNLTAMPYKCKRCGFYHIGKPTFCDDPIKFWNNIFNQMSEYDIKKLQEEV
jgi:hypothetical protein